MRKPITSTQGLEQKTAFRRVGERVEHTVEPYTSPSHWRTPNSLSTGCGPGCCTPLPRGVYPLLLMLRVTWDLSDYRGIGDLVCSAALFECVGRCPCLFWLEAEVEVTQPPPRERANRLAGPFNMRNHISLRVYHSEVSSIQTSWDCF